MANKDDRPAAVPNVKTKKPKPTPLEKAQTRFNRLVKEIAAAEAEQKDQQAWNDRYHQLYQQKVLPLLQQYAAEKLALVRQFDRILAQNKFSKAQQRRYTQWAVETLAEVASYSEEAASLLQQHQQQLYELLPKRQKEKLEELEEKAAPTEEEAWDFADDWEEDGARFEDFFAGGKPRFAAQKEALPGSDDIGPLYKELAKKLHPDLEQDEKEKARKHELMQQLTEARKHRDLYTLLRIKASLEENETTATHWSLEQLKRFNTLLENKLRQLQSGLARVLAGTMLQHGPGVLDGSDPEITINSEVRNLKKTIRNIREDRPRINSREHLEDLLDGLQQDGY